MMHGVMLEVDGTVHVLPSADRSVINQIMGPRHDTLESRDGQFQICGHELNRVAVLPVNAYASTLAGVVIGGAVVVLSPKKASLVSTFTSQTAKKRIQEAVNSEDSTGKMHGLRQRNTDRTMFSFDPPDRWVANGRAFGTIIVGEPESPRDDGVPEFFVWLFGDSPSKHFLMKVVEYSRVEVMEMLLEGDEQIAQGVVPSHLQRAVADLGL